MALNVQKVGMSLLRMDKPDETVRFLDPIDITLSIDSRQIQTHQKTDIEINVQPVIFRSSYRDIQLITDIVNKAISLTSRTSPEAAVASESAVAEGSSSLHPTTDVSRRRRSSRGSRGSTSSPVRTKGRRSTISRSHGTKKPVVVLKKEHVRDCAPRFEGRLFLVRKGDLVLILLRFLFLICFPPVYLTLAESYDRGLPAHPYWRPARTASPSSLHPTLLCYGQ